MAPSAWFLSCFQISRLLVELEIGNQGYDQSDKANQIYSSIVMSSFVTQPIEGTTGQVYLEFLFWNKFARQKRTRP